MVLIFSGTLSEADHKGHIPLAFDVPPGTGQLIGRFRAVPQRAGDAFFDNLISLSLFGPEGARGARHNNPQMDFSVGLAHASPGYMPGPISPGRWTVFLDTFRVLGPDPVQYRLEIDFADAGVAAAPMPLPKVAARGPGWYRGDLHSHSLHSDGSWDVPDLVAWARRRGLDFMTMTDHNTVSSHALAKSVAGDDLLVMGGLELTTHYGHALSLGGEDWQEWRTGPVTGKTMPELAGAVMAAGARFIIAHPMSPGDPDCTGCRWDYPDMRPGPAKIVEVWNGGPWSAYNEDGLALYRQWLGQGHRLALTAGSDIHGPEGDDPVCGFNHVEADDLTEAAILSAIAQGHNYLSSGPKLILTATDPLGAMVRMGDHAERLVAARVAWSTGAAPLELRAIGPDGLFASLDFPAQSEGSVALTDLPPGFFMAELRDATGRLHALTNPIFCG